MNRTKYGWGRAIGDPTDERRLPIESQLTMNVWDASLVAIGGGLGALTRFAIADWTARIAGTAFPWGTLIVNVLGCLAMGAVVKMFFGLDAANPDARISILFWQRAIAIGFLGGMTTFSTFSAETVAAFAAHRPWVAWGNIGLNVVLCLGAVWLGMALVSAASR